MSKTVLFFFLLFVVGLIMIVLFLAGVFDGPSTASTTASVQFTGDLSSSSRLSGRLPDDWASPTEEELIGLNISPEEASYVKLSSTPPGIWQAEFSIFYWRYDATLGKYLYFGLGPNDFEVDLLNVNGKYYNMYFDLNEDIFAQGFGNLDMGSITASQAQTNVDTMVSLTNAADPINILLLQGTLEANPCSGGTRSSLTTYDFNVLTPVVTDLNEDLDFTQITSTTITGNYKGGALRAAMAYVDYTVKLDASNNTVIRVYIGDCDGRMGDKCLVDSNGNTLWYDYVAGEMVSTRNDNVLTFWNGNTVRQTIAGSEEGEAAPDAYKSALITAFRDNLVGMPITLLEDFDTSTLQTIDGTKELKFNLANSPKVRFSGIYGVTYKGTEITSSNVVAMLLANPELQAVYFDLPDLSTQVTLTIE